jgi:hypothetical protein
VTIFHDRAVLEAVKSRCARPAVPTSTAISHDGLNVEPPAGAVGRCPTPCLGRRLSIARTGEHRGIQKRADGGYTGPYSGVTGYVPAAAPIAPGRFTAPAVPNQPVYTGQMINAIGTWNKGDS